MKKYIGKHDVMFCGVLSGLFTWTNALKLINFNLESALFILWNLLFNFVVLTALLWLVTFLLKRPIFGQIKAYYFPLKSMIILSLIVTALFGLVNYIGDDQPMTTTHSFIYIIGYIVNAALLLGYFYYATKKEKP